MYSPRSSADLYAEPQWWFKPRAVREVVAVRTADGRWLRKVAVADGGRDFPCVYVVWEHEPDVWPTPWPIEDVAPIFEHLTAERYEDYVHDA